MWVMQSNCHFTFGNHGLKLFVLGYRTAYAGCRDEP